MFCSCAEMKVIPSQNKVGLYDKVCFQYFRFNTNTTLSLCQLLHTR